MTQACFQGTYKLVRGLAEPDQMLRHSVQFHKLLCSLVLGEKLCLALGGHWLDTIQAFKMLREHEVTVSFTVKVPNVTCSLNPNIIEI